MSHVLNRFFAKLRQGWRVFDRAAREKAVDIIEWETIEMENIFGLLVLGSFVGLPSPPMQVTLELLPYMEKHLLLMLQKVDTSSTAISELVSILDVG
ncbi:MAG: hypothetical protein D6814_11825 [Calditrichaeota bacterium]|nr:MAG: hypothetical protein D6814_11825 [Calditrichota bacterium]